MGEGRVIHSGWELVSKMGPGGRGGVRRRRRHGHRGACGGGRRPRIEEWAGARGMGQVGKEKEKSMAGWGIREGVLWGGGELLRSEPLHAPGRR